MEENLSGGWVPCEEDNASSVIAVVWRWTGVIGVLGLSMSAVSVVIEVMFPVKLIMIV